MRTCTLLCLIGGAAAAPIHHAAADAGGAPRFSEVASEVGINFEHFPSARFEAELALLQSSLESPLTFAELTSGPTTVRGRNGLALIDYDADGDLDIYATNGFGHANPLLQNQLKQTGMLQFVDVAASAGVEATGHESSGTCFADIDNDGDEDIFVVGDSGQHLMFVNQGHGTFVDASSRSGGAFSGSYGGIGCTFADVDNDGLVDLFVGHAWNFESITACFMPFGYNEPNELFHNLGGARFEDISASSGILNNGGVPSGASTITWAVAAFDYDQDGDVDLMTADDNCGVPNANHGGVNRGLIQLFENDGHGGFENVTLQRGLGHDASGQMGISIADFNHDGHLDIFVSNAGDYYTTLQSIPAELGEYTPRWYLGGADGVFSDPGVGGLVAMPFSWGTSAEDFDNDGDADIVFMGGIHAANVASSDNPGSVILNDGLGNFTFDPDVLEEDNTLRNPVGVAAGDLNNDGFVDIVNVSNFDYGSDAPLVTLPFAFGSPFDGLGKAYYPVELVGPDALVWTGIVLPNGSLNLELNRGGKNGSASVRLLGTKAVLSNGSVNRSGVGAVVSFTPKHGKTAIKPVVAGSSCASQDSLTLHFGLRTQAKGTVDVLWPGGVRNRLEGVRAGDQILFPEIPCSYADHSQTPQEYQRCVDTALDALVEAQILTPPERAMFWSSAIHAFRGTSP